MLRDADVDTRVDQSGRAASAPRVRRGVSNGGSEHVLKPETQNSWTARKATVRGLTTVESRTYADSSFSPSLEIMQNEWNYSDVAE